MLGIKFKKLRKVKHISIREAAKGITSRATLQRWEAGKGSMPIEKVIDLLAKIHVQPEEFVHTADNFKVYTQKVSQAYQKNDVQTLYKISIFLLKAHYECPSDLQILFQAAIACNYYMDFTNQNLLNPNDVLRIKAYFLPIEKWTEENVVFFGNIQLLLESNDVYSISRSLFSYLSEQKMSGDFYIIALNTFINAIFVLLKKQCYSKSYQLFRLVKNLNLPSKYVKDRIRLNYIETVFYYIETGKTDKMDIFLMGLEAIGLKQEVDDFKLGFAQFVKIKDKFKL